MRTFFEKIEIKTKKRLDFLDLTPKIQEIIRKNNIKQGIIVLTCLHTTAALILNEQDETVHKDFEKISQKLVPENFNYKHLLEGEINARAHQLSMIYGNTLFLTINQGNLVLGTWQSVFFIEFLEPRKRQVAILILGE